MKRGNTQAAIARGRDGDTTPRLYPYLFEALAKPPPQRVVPFVASVPLVSLRLQRDKSDAVDGGGFARASYRGVRVYSIAEVPGRIRAHPRKGARTRRARFGQGCEEDGPSDEDFGRLAQSTAPERRSTAPVERSTWYFAQRRQYFARRTRYCARWRRYFARRGQNTSRASKKTRQQRRRNRSLLAKSLRPKGTPGNSGLRGATRRGVLELVPAVTQATCRAEPRSQARCRCHGSYA